jgi:hypothetical protein
MPGVTENLITTKNASMAGYFLPLGNDPQSVGTQSHRNHLACPGCRNAVAITVQCDEAGRL